MIFKRGTRENLITLRERKTRYLVAIKNTSKEAMGTAVRLISTMSSMKNCIKSITFDQGSEFKKYLWIKDCLNTDIYFCESGSPHQKGGIENGNSVIRLDFPRTFNMQMLKQKEVNKIIKKLNDRPLKCLNYKTPYELFYEN